MRTRIKICCIASVDDAALAIAAGADAVGLVGAMPSGPGPITDDRIAEITASVPPPVASFLLTSEISARAIAAHIHRTNAAVVQVVSHIDPSETKLLAVLLPHTRRVQVIHVDGPHALDHIPLYAPWVHAFLLDSGRPSAKIPELGGTGRVHDWQVSAAFVKASPAPVFLAGGLNPENVGEAIRTVRPFGVDICSGMRIDGRLDRRLLDAFVSAVRDADSDA